MIRKNLFCIITIALVCLTTVGMAEDKLVRAVDFEKGNPGELPAGWTISQAKGDANIIGLNDSQKKSGNLSFSIFAENKDSVTIQSDVLQLKVGNLYRLSGWIKTEGVYSDPTARYPTALPACLTMYSFPFTENSPTVGGTSDWQYVEKLFLATKGKDHIQLHLGLNGWSTGKAWFDDIKLEEVDDITEFIPMETVRWFGDGYRYDDKGWIFVHIEGEPYERGYQYGYLVGKEISQYILKLGRDENGDDIRAGWNSLRFITKSLYLRKYDEEYLVEMKGIADGAAKAGNTVFDRPIDLVDIVTINSVIDIGQMHRALDRNENHLTGRNFLREEEEMLLSEKYNKCSSFVATGSTTTDGRFVFGQIFMWGGYTGVHWDVICDVQPTTGHRLVYHTFPGGIHSGADFYINEAGIVIGETTVSQTPFDNDGTPQSNRIRKAAQYASTFEEVRDILFEKNNGMYTNDWTLANAKTDEGGCLLLGTKKYKLWRTGNANNPADTPAGHKDFIWANNNNRDLEVRKEYIPHPENAPYDLIFRPANRDVAFQEFYEEYKDGKIDSITAINLWASSPINRAHACDGKITTGEMADKLVFLAHYGKTTLREKMVGGRWIRDYDDAKPHLTLGYSVASPIFITEKLKQARDATKVDAAKNSQHKVDLVEAVEEAYSYDKHDLWQNTVYPATDKEAWFISATASYWRTMRYLNNDVAKAMVSLRENFTEYNYRYLYLVDREEDIKPVETSQVYDRYNHYYMPRLKGVYLLHQLRLLMGNAKFSMAMNTIHDQFMNKEITNEDIIRIFSDTHGKDLTAFIKQWIDQTGLPSPQVTVRKVKTPAGQFEVFFTINQPDENMYDFITTVCVETENAKYYQPVHVSGKMASVSVDVDYEPIKAIFNVNAEIPVEREMFYTMGNLIDDFHHTTMVYGTKRQIEANHTMCKRWCETLADGYLEILIPIKKDSEICEKCLKNRDLIVMGGPADNSLTAKMAEEGLLPITFAKNCFTFNGKVYNDVDDGLVLAMPNPYNKKRVLYLYITNSQLQMYDMTSRFRYGMPAWTIFKGKNIADGGYHAVKRFEFEF